MHTSGSRWQQKARWFCRVSAWQAPRAMSLSTCLDMALQGTAAKQDISAGFQHGNLQRPRLRLPAYMWPTRNVLPSDILRQGVSTAVCRGHVSVYLPGHGPPGVCCEIASQQQHGQSAVSYPPPVNLVEPGAGPVPTCAGCYRCQGLDGRLCNVSHLSMLKASVASCTWCQGHSRQTGCSMKCVAGMSGHVLSVNVYPPMCPLLGVHPTDCDQPVCR